MKAAHSQEQPVYKKYQYQWFECKNLFFKSDGFPGGTSGKEPTCNVGDLGSVPGLGRCPGEGKGYPLQYSGLYSPRGCKELNMTQ